MGLIALIKSGFFANFINFSNPMAMLAVWVFLIAGFAGQSILNKKAAKPEVQWSLLIVLLVLIIICQIGSNAFPGNDFGKLIFVFGIFICAAVGAGASGLIWYIRKKRRDGR